PNAEPDDGVLEVAAIRPRGAFGWVRVWNTFVIDNGILRRTGVGRRIADWRSQNVRDVIYRQATTALLQLDRPVAFQLDGEDGGDAVSARLSIDPGSLVVRVAP